LGAKRVAGVCAALAVASASLATARRRWSAVAASYPAVFVVTSDHDVRVAPLHSYKIAAALQAAQRGPGRILLRVETESGHGGGSTIDQEIAQQTEVLAFFARNLGLSLH
jgi:prolyl oligopeptidase